MPGAVPLSSALALNHAVSPYGLVLADKGWKQAMLEDKNLRNGLNVLKGEITYENVANSLDLPWNPQSEDLVSDKIR
jgi:alanine dehydrogenase